MPRGRFQRASRPAGQTGRGVAGSKCAGRPAKGPFCSGPVAASAAQAGPSGACLQAQGSAFLWAVHGRVQERTRDSSDSPQGPLHVLAVHRARPDLSEVRAGQPARPSGPLGLSLASPPRWALCCPGGLDLREAERNPGEVSQAGKELTCRKSSCWSAQSGIGGPRAPVSSCGPLRAQAPVKPRLAPSAPPGDTAPRSAPPAPASVCGAAAAPGGAVGCAAAGARGGNLEARPQSCGPENPRNHAVPPPPPPVFPRQPLDRRGPPARCQRCPLFERHPPPQAPRELQPNTGAACHLPPAPPLQSWPSGVLLPKVGGRTDTQKT